jgi:hypothetical protein
MPYGPESRLYAASLRGGYAPPPWASGGGYRDERGSTLGDLIGYQGQLQAQRHQAGSDMLAGAVQQAGAQLANYFNEREQKKELAKRDAATVAAIEGWDGQSPMQLYQGLQKIRPHDALQYTNAVLALRGGERKEPEKELERLGKIAQFMSDQPDEVVARGWPMIRQSVGATAGRLGIPLPEQWDPKERGVLGKIGEVFGPKREARKLQTLGPGQVAFDEATGEVVAKGPEKPEERKLHALSPGQMMVDESGAVVAKAPAAPREPKEERLLPVTTSDPQTGEPMQTYITESQARQMAASGGGIKKPESTATQNRMSAARSSIQAGEELLSKLKDPKFASQLGPIQGRYNSLAAAAGAGDPAAQELVGSIRSFAALQPQIHGFRAHAMAQDVENLLATKNTPESLAAGLKGILTASYIVAGNNKGGGGQPVRIQNAADYAKLPSGAVFIDPNGKTRRKP